MRKFSISVLLLCIMQISFAQKATKICSSNMRKNAMAKVDSLLKIQRSAALGPLADFPYMIKLSVVIFANDNGTNVAGTHADVHRQIDNMVRFYYPHEICFNLGDIRQVNNTNLNNMHIYDDESLLDPYIRTGYITIFVHSSLSDGKDFLNGFAYDIPNYYLSIADEALSSTDNLSTMAHEMGHCFGLYHTFEDAFGEENAARSGGCKDCEDDGDYLCDTEADRDPISITFIDPNTCTYTGSRRDECGAILQMEVQNIMSYGNRSCRRRFSPGQGSRARSFILTDTELSDALAGENVNLIVSFTYTNDYRIYLAKNAVTFNANNYTATGTAKVIASANAIVVKPGTHFNPSSSSGYAVLHVNPYCQ